MSAVCPSEQIKQDATNNLEVQYCTPVSTEDYDNAEEHMARTE